VLGWKLIFFSGGTLKMVRYVVVCLLFTGMVWGQAEPAASPVSRQEQANPSAPPASATGSEHAAPVDPGKDLPPDSPVLTVAGLCDYASTGKAFDPKCKTVITRKQFDVITNLLKPGAPPLERRVLAKEYLDILVKSQDALEMGLDKDPNFPDRVEVLRLLFYAKNVDKALNEKEWEGVTEKEIEDEYKNHANEYVMADVSRIFLPRFPPDDDPNEKLTDAEKQKRQDDWDAKLKQEADSLRARALAGEDFLKLQSEAYKLTGVNDVRGPQDIKVPNVLRRNFDPDQKSVMDLKPGEISPVLYDPTRGYCIFRMEDKHLLPLEKVKNMIRKQFEKERVQKDQAAIRAAATITYNDTYLGPASPEDSATFAGDQPTANQAQATPSK
jgi:hypothetical protein